MKVFGIGLNKTGTTSLGKALEILGYKDHISWSADLSPDLIKKWSEKNIDAILSVAEKYNNLEDWPWPLVYKELYEKFDDAKFILTKRTTPERWYHSLCEHRLRHGSFEHHKLIYGYYFPHDFKREHIEFYNNHNRQVIDFFKKKAPEKLLVISFSDGNNWGKLCNFLNVGIPSLDFPHLNQSNPINPVNNETSLTVSNKLAIRLIKIARAIKKPFTTKK